MTFFSFLNLLGVWFKEKRRKESWSFALLFFALWDIDDCGTVASWYPDDPSCTEGALNIVQLDLFSLSFQIELYLPGEISHPLSVARNTYLRNFGGTLVRRPSINATEAENVAVSIGQLGSGGLLPSIVLQFIFLLGGCSWGGAVHSLK